jgi:hypothetical protein
LVNGRIELKYRIQVIVALLGVLATFCTLEDSAEAQNLRELARAHAAGESGVALELTAPPGDYLPKEIDALATESDVVLRGRLARIKTYLGPNEDRILTDYQIHVEQLIAGSLPHMTSKVPGGAPALTLTVYGGELTIEGVLVRATDANRDQIVDRKSYLLFLMRSRRGEPGSYEIYYGGIFEVSDQRVRPLLRQGDRIFKGTAGLTLEDLIQRIKASRRKLP